MLQSDEDTKKEMSFSSVRILISTCFRHFIKGWISFRLGEFGCEVFVKEIGSGMSSGFIRS